MPGLPLPRHTLGVIETQEDLGRNIVEFTRANCAPSSEEIKSLVARMDLDLSLPGNNPNTNSNYTLINLVVKHGTAEDLTLLLTRTHLGTVQKLHNRSFVYEALNVGKLNNAGILLDHGASIDGLGALGDNVLHAAVNNQAPVSLLQRLVDAGADPKARNKYDLTVLDMALEFNTHVAKGYIDFLVGNGAREWAIKDHPEMNEYIQLCVAQELAKDIRNNMPSGRTGLARKI